MINLKYIVVGTGRCGTVYFARFLTDLGIPCGHESIFDVHSNQYNLENKLNNGDVSLSMVSKREHLTGKLHPEWVDLKRISADSSYLSAPLLNHRALENCSVFHVIRNPLDVINSFVLDGNFFTDNLEVKTSALHWIYHIRPYEKIMSDNVPEILCWKNSIDKAAVYYMGWNELIEANSLNKKYYRHKIENGITQEVFEFFNLEPTDSYFNNKKINSWNNNRTFEYTLDDLSEPIRIRLEKMMKRYGYLNVFF